MLHKWHHQNKEEKQSNAVFKICGSELRDSYECDLETQNQLLGRMCPSELVQGKGYSISWGVG